MLPLFVEEGTGEPGARVAEISASVPKYRQQGFSEGRNCYRQGGIRDGIQVATPNSRAIPLKCSRFAVDYPLLLVHRWRRFRANVRLQRRTICMRLVRTHTPTWGATISV